MRKTLLEGLGPKVDRLRGIQTRVGARPFKVYLVWTLWGGVERGAGVESEKNRIEITPRPKVSDLTSLAYSAVSTGVLPIGSIKVTEISTRFTADQLTGKAQHEDFIAERESFFWEVVEDGRADKNPTRAKFRIAAAPFLDAENIQWIVTLERISEDNTREGKSRA